MKETVVVRFFEAFKSGDYQVMNSCYSQHSTFEDPVFGILSYAQTQTMWSMLLRNKQHRPTITFNIISRNTTTAKIRWTAHYLFPLTNRKIKNNVLSHLSFRNDRIENQKDHFSMLKWCLMAYGIKGLFISLFFKKKLRDQFRKQLMKYESIGKK